MTTTETTNLMKTEIPAKAWNEMKGVMEDTSLPEWQKYYADLKAHNDTYAKAKPVRENFPSENEYLIALNNWSFDEAMSAPNKPGYYRANND